MTIRKIAQIGHPILRQPARPVRLEEIDTPAFQALVDDLVETMRDASGAGLAAPQIHEPLRLFAVEVSRNPRYPYKPDIPLTVLINPVVKPLSDDRFENFEGCLSVPNLRGMVQRWAHVRVTGLDRHGQPFERIAKGFTAGTFQHELDHLDATIFVDRVEDPRTLTTWTEFERYHREAFLVKAQAIIDRWGE
ncbi:MAG: peptide deformylase [Deltaproteobacteria bacterium]|nr:peptide deformylase [Deltaproteobacteria bacterium]